MLQSISTYHTTRTRQFKLWCNLAWTREVSILHESGVKALPWDWQVQLLVDSGVYLCNPHVIQHTSNHCQLGAPRYHTLGLCTVLCHCTRDEVVQDSNHGGILLLFTKTNEIGWGICMQGTIMWWPISSTSWRIEATCTNWLAMLAVGSGCYGCQDQHLQFSLSGQWVTSPDGPNAQTIHFTIKHASQDVWAAHACSMPSQLLSDQCVWWHYTRNFIYGPNNCKCFQICDGILIFRLRHPTTS